MRELANEFSWSKSRDRAFQECKRAYYYKYYGSWGGWDPQSDPEARQLYILKNLQTRRQWLGTVVHDVALWAVKEVSAGRAPAADAAWQVADKRMRGDFLASLNGRYRERPKKECGLQEHFYAVPVDGDEWKALHRTAADCVKNLFATSAWKRLASAGPEAILSAEKLDEFTVRGVKVFVVLDLALRREDGGVAIIDWKTGEGGAGSAEETRVQLGVYGLYGQRRWGLPPERISAYEVNLRTGAETQHKVDREALLQVEAAIEGSARAMQALLDDPARNAASKERFPMTEQLWRCAHCAFRRPCDREHVPEAAPAASDAAP